MADKPQPEFQIDEPVRLKTGGPDMLVDRTIEVHGQYHYRCMWLEGESMRIANYNGEQLERVPADD